MYDLFLLICCCARQKFISCRNPIGYLLRFTIDDEIPPLLLRGEGINATAFL